MIVFFRENKSLLLTQVLLFVVFLLYAAKQSFWHDEIHTLAIIRGIDVYPFEGSDFSVLDGFYSRDFYQKLLFNEDSFYSNFFRNIIHEGHPPLYYIFLKFWTYFAGFDEIGLRSFSILTSIFTLGIFHRISKLLNIKKLNIFCLLFAITPFFVYFALEARSYSLYLFLSTYCLYFFLRTIRNNDSESSSLVKFSIISTLLLYTHYYGLFLIISLSLLLVRFLVKTGNFRKITLLLIPAFCFIPWFYIISKQTSAHEQHWTDGALSITDSVFNFFVGVMELNFSYSSIGIIRFVLLLLVSILIIGFFLKQRKLKILYLLVFAILFTGFQIIVFDLILDHHTIAIPRYYISIMPLVLVLFMLVSEHNKFKLISTLSVTLLILTLTYCSYFVLDGKFKAKQNYRDLAYFIDSNYTPDDFFIIVAPHGPSTLALGYYLSKNFMIKGIESEDVCGYYSIDSCLIVEQKLGVNTEPWHIECDKKVIIEQNFIGLDLVRKK